MDVDGPAVFGDDAVDERQAEIGSLAGGARREERIEDSLEDIGRNAVAVVRNRETHETACAHRAVRQRARRLDADQVEFDVQCAA
nr:hypothetical protein [Burkholderia pyrrocinia]